MARTESRTKTAIWSNGDFCALAGPAQRMYWLLYSQPTISLCGVVALTEGRWAKTAKGETVESVRAALRELHDAGFVLVDWDYEEVFVRTFARHDGVDKNVKIRFAAWGQLGSIASPTIRAAAEEALSEFGPRPESGGGMPHPENENGASFDQSSVDNPVGFNSGRDESNIGRDEFNSGTRARARPPSPVPVSNPLPQSPVPDGDEGTGATHETQGQQAPGFAKRLDLARQVASICTADNRKTVHTEAAALVDWAQVLDPRLVEEAVGWARKQETKPVLPRALASVISKKAADGGYSLPPFKPTRESA